MFDMGITLEGGFALAPRCRSQPMRFIRNMIDRRRVWAGLGDYPVYSPPSRYGGSIPSRDEMTANFNYFLETKADRLKYLAEYLTPFSVDLRLEPPALP